MTNEEINNELKNSLEWFLKASGKSKKIIVENNDKISSYVDIHSTTMTVNEETEKYD